MKTEYKIIMLSVVLGLLFWVIEAVLDYIIFYKGSFLGSLISDVPPHEVYSRLIVIALFLIFGILISRVLSKRRKAEDALRKSEEKYRNLFESTRDGIVFTDMEGKILETNQAYLDMLGYSKEEIKKLSYIDITPAKWHDMEADIVKNQFIARGYSDEYEKEYIRKDGTVFPINIRGWLINDEKGNPVGMWGFIRDITERKRAEEGLRKSEEKYKHLFQSSFDGIAESDLEGNIISCNQAYLNMTGHSEEEIVKLKYQDLTPEKWHEVDKKRVEQCLQRGYSDLYEKERIGKDGTIFPISIRIWLRRDEQGNPLSLWGIVQNITERKKAEEKLQKSEERYRLLLNAITSYVYTVSVENGKPAKTTHSSRCIGVTGYTSEDYEAEPFLWFNMVHEEDRDLVREQAAQVLSGKSAPPLEHRIIHKDGSIRWVRNTPVSHYDEQGQMVSYDGVIEDITERKKAEE